ncbi:MAG: hypothetical protein U1D66_08415, partial [Erythrobacter sp.]|nr:hypothetical protein [Erythrobacter sp.]
LVFDPSQRRAASYAYLLAGDEYQSRLNLAEREVNDVERDGWFTAGLTAHSGIFRLLPNHRVNTRDFRMKRNPLRMPEYNENVDQTVDQMASEIAKVVAAVRADRPTEIGLTGGNETRAILAALRKQSADVTFVTVAFEASTIDVHLSKRIAKTHGLNHRILPQKKADERQQELWLIGAGHAMAGSNKHFHPSMEPLAGHVLVGGLGGEVGRGFLWPSTLSADEQISDAYILARLKQPLSPENLAAAMHWRTQLPENLDAFQVLDLAYLELRMGTWACAQPRMPMVPRAIHPLISYNQFSRMWSIPPAIRQGDQMIRVLIQRNWSELLDIPVNKYGDFRDHLFLFNRIIKRPDKVLRKIKQILHSKLRD